PSCLPCAARRRSVAPDRTPRGTTATSGGPRPWPASLLFLHFFLELPQLAVGRRFPAGPIEARLEKLLPRIRPGARAARRLQVVPRALGGALRLRERTILFGARQLPLHVRELPLVPRPLVPSRR